MRILSLFTMFIALTACATGYQKKGHSGGYSSTRLDANIWIVKFSGNGFTGRERAQDFALLRCAELALQNGYKYFTVHESEKYSATGTHTTPKVETRNTSSGGRTRKVSKPRVAFTIECHKEKQDTFSYNAEYIAQSIREKYGL